MSRTFKTTNIKVRNRFKFLKKIGWGQKYYSLLNCISSEYNRFFPIELPYIVSVTHDECCIHEITFKNEESSVTFTYPHFQGTGYTFGSISEERVATSNGLQHLIHKKFIHESGFSVYTSYIGPEPKPESITFPFKPAFEDLIIQFKHPYRKKCMFAYVKTCMDIYYELSNIFHDGKPFRFADLFNIVLNNFDIPIEELEKFEISGILKFSDGKIYTATSYTKPDQIVKICKDVEAFLSPMCNYYSENKTVHRTFVNSKCSLDIFHSAKTNYEKFYMKAQDDDNADDGKLDDAKLAGSKADSDRLNDGEFGGSKADSDRLDDAKLGGDTLDTNVTKRNQLYAEALKQLDNLEKEIEFFCSIKGSKSCGS